MSRVLVLGAALLVVGGVPVVARGACAPAPIAACRTAPKGVLRVDDAPDDTRDRLRWTWSGGGAVAAGVFGDPTAATGYTLCVYDPTSLVAEAGLPAGGTCGTGPCWRPVGTNGFAYRDAHGASAGVGRVRLKASSRGVGAIVFDARGVALPTPALPLLAPLTIQLRRDDTDVCFETIFTAATLVRDDTNHLLAKAKVEGTTPVPALASAACGAPSPYPTGISSVDSLVHDGLTRTFRVYVPPGYDVAGPVPVVLALHGGFGSGAQIETSAQVVATAAAEGFIAVSPDGVPGDVGIRTWNGGTCCGYAAAHDVDDVGFVAALLDHLEARLCIDRRRVYAMGMSNGAILSYRLACELSSRIRAVGPVSGTIMVDPCTPGRPVPMRHVHGTDDANLPFAGGLGCGPAGVAFTPVPDAIAGAAGRNGCTGSPVVALQEGDGTCVRQGDCPAGSEVELCTIAGGGHQWPGGEPPVVAGLPGCPFGYQSQSFDATTELWSFFSTHPPR